MPVSVRARTKKTNRIVHEQRASYKTPASRSDFKRVTRKQINAVVRKIVDEFNPEKVILFGSYAYGKPTMDSDVDLLIVMESQERSAHRGMRITRELLDVPFPLDILVRTPQEIMRRLKVADYFFQEIMRQGRVLYER